MSDSAMGDEVYQPDGSEVRDDAALVDPQDSLEDRGVDEAWDEGYSPPERTRAAEDVGTTAQEQRDGETLDERLAREQPEISSAGGDGIGDLTAGDGEPLDSEVGQERAGRLVAPDGGIHGDEEKDLIADDVGIDGSAASAEEAAVHRVSESERDERF